VIPDTLDHVTQGELQRYENNYKSLNLIITALDRNVYDRVAHLETLMMYGLSCATHMRALLRLSLHIEIPIIDITRLSLRNLESLSMIALLVLSQLLAAYVHVVLLLILIMNVLNNCCMLMMTMCRA
jgi:hypothetical protein